MLTLSDDVNCSSGVVNSLFVMTDAISGIVMVVWFDPRRGEHAKRGSSGS